MFDRRGVPFTPIVGCPAAASGLLVVDGEIVITLEGKIIIFVSHTCERRAPAASGATAEAEAAPPEYKSAREVVTPSTPRSW